MSRSWREPWGPLPVERPELAATLEAELRRELGAGHPLLGVPAAAIGRHAGCDDVLFALADGRFAVVHLTWIGREERAPWPVAEVFEDWAGFEAGRMAGGDE